MFGDEVNPYEFHQRISFWSKQASTRAFDLLVDARFFVVENPDQGALSERGDRTVPKLHRRVRLSPGTEHLAHLEGRLARDRRGHPSTEEDELQGVLRHVWRPSGELRDRLVC